MRVPCRRAKLGKLAGLIAAIVLLATSAPPASGQEPDTSSTTSTSHHPHALYYGTLTLTRAGESTPYVSAQGFEVQIRFSQQGADQTAAKLSPDQRIPAGFGGMAPDGGSWITL